jgi:hypothetical protein
LPARSPERQRLILGCADLHGVSIATIYRALRDQFRPRSLHRSDRGRPRKLPQREMERFCELVAAMKLRTTNLKNRHLSTGRAIELLVEHGIETPEGLVRAPPGLLTRTTVNRYLRHWGLDDERRGRPPPARRFQAEHANDCWQFDLSPSDLKQVPAPLWVEAGRGPPTLMLFSAVDDRSGVAYQEYRWSMARMSLPHCASCSTPWRPRRSPAWCCRASRRCSTWTMARSRSLPPSAV